MQPGVFLEWSERSFIELFLKNQFRSIPQQVVTLIASPISRMVRLLWTEIYIPPIPNWEILYNLPEAPTAGVVFGVSWYILHNIDERINYSRFNPTHYIISSC